MDRESLRELRRIPGVGPSIAADLWSLGIRGVSDLRGSDPEAMYAELCRQAGKKLDRCLLYVFRCAVYFATQAWPEAELLKWWNWKDAPTKKLHPELDSD
jgi:hypothetical protein